MEKWKDVKGYEGIYKISDNGRVKSLARMRTTRNWGKELKMPIKERILKSSLRGGYPFVVLSDGSGLKKNIHIHRLVGKAFIDNPDNKKIVNHKNGIKTDNHKENLEWVTHIENKKHAIETGLEMLYGSLNPTSKLSEKEVENIFIMLSNGDTHKSIALKYMVNRTCITSIARRKTWKHVKIPNGCKIPNRENLRGENNGNHRLNKESVINIKKMLSEGKTLTEIALIFNTSIPTIFSIKNGKTWRQI